MFRILCLAVALTAGPALSADKPPPYTLPELRAAARAGHPALAAARAQVAGGQAQIVSAAAYPNPELEFLTGRTQARVPGVTSGSAQSLAVTQRIDNPWQREARIAAAGFNLDALQAGRRGFENDLLARLDQRFFELLRRQADLRAGDEDLAIAAQIHSRVSLRVQTGEAPRYELIKAETELLNARKSAESAALRVAQARAGLRALVGANLPGDFEIDPQTRSTAELPTLDELRAELLARNPELARGRAELQRAERQLELERLRRQPDLAIKLAQDQDSEIRNSRIGVVLSVPLWDRRAGPIGEAAAQLALSRSDAASQELALVQGLEAAYRQYEIARTQVGALENGILRAAEAALKVAEAAWRFGERGILDYLDAQRVFRAARNELIAARYELQLAVIEIERLRAPQ